MEKKKSELKLLQEKAEAAVERTNEKIDELGKNTSLLYDKLTEMQSLFDAIRNMPSDKKQQYEELKKIRLNWKEQVEKIEKNYKNAAVKNTGKGAAGIGAGVAVAALGPTAAMGIATTFGVASTGTAISTLSGAAATNAALAWLGGGSLAVGGGGMAAGEALLALAGPIGWAIAGVAVLSSGLMLWKAQSDKKSLEKVFTLISERDIDSYELAIVELNERIVRIHDESSILSISIEKAKSFGLNYNKMTKTQQYELGSYVNLMSASTQLLVNPILGLLPKYSEADYENYARFSDKTGEALHGKKDLIITLANLFYKIDLDETDKKLLWKFFRKNKNFLASMKMEKKDFDSSILDTVCDALNYKQKSEENREGRM